jgi:hypothetical protein
MARLIDADAILEEHCDGCSLAQREECKAKPVCGLAMWIVEAPTVDAVEVVRCKDCKFLHDRGYCTLVAGLTRIKHDDYCSRGERRTDG